MSAWILLGIIAILAVGYLIGSRLRCTYEEGWVEGRVALHDAYEREGRLLRWRERAPAVWMMPEYTKIDFARVPRRGVNSPQSDPGPKPRLQPFDTIRVGPNGLILIVGLSVVRWFYRNIQYQTGSDWKDWAPIDIKVNGLVEVES